MHGWLDVIVTPNMPNDIKVKVTHNDMTYVVTPRQIFIAVVRSDYQSIRYKSWLVFIIIQVIHCLTIQSAACLGFCHTIFWLVQIAISLTVGLADHLIDSVLMSHFSFLYLTSVFYVLSREQRLTEVGDQHAVSPHCTLTPPPLYSDFAPTVFWLRPYCTLTSPPLYSDLFPPHCTLTPPLHWQLRDNYDSSWVRTFVSASNMFLHDSLVSRSVRAVRAGMRFLSRVNSHVPLYVSSLIRYMRTQLTPVHHTVHLHVRVETPGRSYRQFTERTRFVVFFFFFK